MFIAFDRICMSLVNDIVEICSMCMFIIWFCSLHASSCIHWCFFPYFKHIQTYSNIFKHIQSELCLMHFDAFWCLQQACLLVCFTGLWDLGDTIDRRDADDSSTCGRAIETVAKAFRHQVDICSRTLSDRLFQCFHNTIPTSSGCWERRDGVGTVEEEWSRHPALQHAREKNETLEESLDGRHTGDQWGEFRNTPIPADWA